jgi:hypothetical protein
VKVSVGPNTILQPHPVLVVGTWCPDGKPNIMTASWGGTGSCNYYGIGPRLARAFSAGRAIGGS